MSSKWPFHVAALFLGECSHLHGRSQIPIMIVLHQNGRRKGRKNGKEKPPIFQSPELETVLIASPLLNAES